MPTEGPVTGVAFQPGRIDGFLTVSINRCMYGLFANRPESEIYVDDQRVDFGTLMLWLVVHKCRIVLQTKEIYDFPHKASFYKVDK